MRIVKKDPKCNKTERMQQKTILCVSGIILLFIITIASFEKTPVSTVERSEVTVPEEVVVVEEFYNVYITEVTDTTITFFEDDYKTYHLRNGVSDNDAGELLYCKSGNLADVTVTNQEVSYVKIRGDQKVSGKVVSVSVENGIELENAGRLLLDENVKVYCLYGALKKGTLQDIRIGYQFADFVLENGKICGVLLTRDEAMEYIRVQILDDNYSDGYHDSVELSCDTGFRVVYGAEALNSISSGDVSGSDVVQEFYPAGQQITIAKDNPYFVSEGTNKRIYIVPQALTGKISLHSVRRSQGTPSYRGMIEIMQSEQGLVVINEVLLEEYLYAVVPSEMPASYPLEALKAQAICARTYAYSNILRPGLPEIGAHVNDSTAFQVYNNIEEQMMTTMAVNETEGQLLYIGEDLANTYYYSTSCGFGTDEHVWKSQTAVELPHLTAKAMNSAGTGSIYNAESMCEENTFREFITNVQEGDFEKEESWYRWSYQVTDIDEEHILKVLQSRYAANADLVLMEENGAYISRKPEKLGTIQDITVIKRNAGGVADEVLIAGSKATYKIISELCIRYILCDGKTRVSRQDGSMADMNSLLPSGFFCIDTVKEEENVIGYTVIGGGFGHGVGMSQNSAKNMALTGYTAQQILEFFYNDCNVRKAE